MWFRYIVVAFVVLILCSCRAIGPQGQVGSYRQPGPEANPFAAAQPQRQVMPVVYHQDQHLPPPIERQAEYAAGIRPAQCQMPGCSCCNGCGDCGIVGPRDEYLCDGGDSRLPAGVKADWEIVGLEQEDTVAHYDTVDGRTIITPSNRVCIYAPRFGVVRRVIDLHEYARYDAAIGYGQATALAKIDERERPAHSINKLEPTINRVQDPASLLRERQQLGELGREERLAAEIGTLSPYCDLQVVKAGIFVGDEKVKIARSSLAAITWTGDQSPQITVDSRNAVAAVSDRQPGVIYHLEEPNKPCLRLIKLASCGSAKQGEIVEFTLRLDNVGNREMGNVTVVDNLTTRLEYVPDSAKASVAADFSTEPNSGGSEVLRWEIKEPLEAGAGCILQFKCKVL
ncbi:hypothetical protein Pla144_36990 [Bythopirellula polymerisocia]|uniref:DUF11 domain-containing protein n=1 Tax=Bythopirellula polymerisocia TaxID=2528003 RepID=A0A5C6CJ83_9BACT|nr:hypothetical protein Pla144_36990 [Bythopirellula polymerisocia]